MQQKIKADKIGIVAGDNTSVNVVISPSKLFRPDFLQFFGGMGIFLAVFLSLVALAMNYLPMAINALYLCIGFSLSLGTGCYWEYQIKKVN